MKKIVLAFGVVALGLVAVPAAQSASSTDCLGRVPNVLGTSGNDVIKIWAGEGGIVGSVNGRTVRNTSTDLAVIYSRGGNDTITFSGDPGSALICAGDGKDTITGNKMRRVHAGSGYDTVRQHLLMQQHRRGLRRRGRPHQLRHLQRRGPLQLVPEGHWRLDRWPPRTVMPAMRSSGKFGSAHNVRP